MDAGSLFGEFRQFSALLCCNLCSASARFAGQGSALQIPSPSSHWCCELKVSAPPLCSPALPAAPVGCWLLALRCRVERGHCWLGFASSGGTVPQGVWTNVPSRGITVELRLEWGSSFGWAEMLGWEPMITALHAPARRFPSLTLFYLRQQEKLLLLFLHLSGALTISPQGHDRQSSGQALPPRVLHVRRLWPQPEAARVFLHRRAAVLRDARKGEG